MDGTPDDRGYLANVSGNALYRSVVRAMSEGVVVLDLAGRVVEANPSAARILGLSAEALDGRTAADSQWKLLQADGTPAPLASIPSEITRRSGVPCRAHRLGVRRDDGHVTWLDVDTDPVLDESGAMRLVVATFTDVTEIIAQRAELDRSRTHLKNVVDIAPGVVFQYQVHADGRESNPFLSERLQTMLGIAPADVMRDPSVMWSQVHPRDLPAIVTAMRESQRDLTPAIFEFRFRGPQGEWQWLRSQAVPQRVDDGTVWTGILLDVSREHDLADRLRRAARREAMGELAAGLAHNFNNLLASILPNIELALGCEDEAEREPLLEDALQASRNAADLVRQLLAFTRSETAEAPQRPVDLATIVRDTLRFCRRTFDRRIHIEEEIDPGPLVVVGNASNLQQIVMNLCLNARDAMTKRTDPHLNVALTRVDDGSTPEASLVIEDNGVGMSPETVRRLGEPFFTTKSPGLGTGLGLATVHGILRDCGGSLRCDSRVGIGTRFEVRLPCVTGELDDASAELLPVARRLSGVALIIDDERLVRAAFRRQLQSLGLDVVEADGGDSALATIMTMPRPPDVIMLDLAMPGMTGEQVLEVLVARWPEIPVVVVSGNRGPSHILDGARAVLRKPVELETLLQTLTSLLG